MAIPVWNFDWTSDDSWVEALFDARIYNRFVDAVNERIIATPDFGSTLVSHATTGQEILPLWRGLSVRIYSLRTAFWPAYDGGGSPLTYTGDNGATAIPQTFDWGVDGAGFANRPPWYGRMWPREIHALSDPGTAGELARLVWNGGPKVPPYGGIYQYAGGAWTPAPVGSRADVLSGGPSGGGGDAVGWAYAGDYFGVTGMGSQFLNGLRDTLNNYVVSFKSWDGSAGYWDTDPGTFQVGWTSKGEPNWRHLAATGQFTLASWNAVTGVNLVSAPFAYNRTANTALGEQMSRAYGYPVVWNIPLAGVMNRQVIFLMQAGLASSTLPAQYERFGDPLAAGVGDYYGSAAGASTSAASFIGDKFGSLDFTGWGSPDAPSGDGKYHGYTLDYFSSGGGLTALIRWDVGGGFGYTKYT